MNAVAIGSVVLSFLWVLKTLVALGAMETGYQRSRIQEESLHYEKLKHDGTHPIVGVNTFLDPHRSENVLEASALTRGTREEKDARLAHVADFQARHSGSGVRGQAVRG